MSTYYSKSNYNEKKSQENTLIERAIFQTFWKLHCCAKFLFFELKTSNFGSSYVFLSPLKWQGWFLPNLTFWNQKWHISGKMPLTYSLWPCISYKSVLLNECIFAICLLIYWRTYICNSKLFVVKEENYVRKYGSVGKVSINYILPKICQFWVQNVKLGKNRPRHFNGLKKL